MSDLNLPAQTVSLIPGLGAAQKIPQKILGKGASEKEIEQVAKDFESLLLGKLLEEMKRTIPESGLFESPITKQVQNMFWFYLAQDLSQKGGMGLWKEIYRQLNQTAVAPADGPAVEQLL